jgi:hypothetical protein
VRFKHLLLNALHLPKPDIATARPRLPLCAQVGQLYCRLYIEHANTFWHQEIHFSRGSELGFAVEAPQQKTTENSSKGATKQIKLIHKQMHKRSIFCF